MKSHHTTICKWSTQGIKVDLRKKRSYGSNVDFRTTIVSASNVWVQVQVQVSLSLIAWWLSDDAFLDHQAVVQDVWFWFVSSQVGGTSRAEYLDIYLMYASFIDQN